MPDITATTCPCPCHEGRSYTPCTVPGGCGHLHPHHQCRRAERCAEWVWWDTTHPDTGAPTRLRVGADINSTDGLCLACIRHTERALSDLPRDYTELAMLLGRTGNTAGEPVSGSRELPVPIRLGVEAVQAAMVAEATCWAEAVAETLQVEWDSHRVDHHTRPGVALQRAAHLLANAMSPLLAVRGWTRMVWQPDGCTPIPETRDGVDGAVTLLELHHQARRILGVTRVVFRMPAPCGGCRRLTLCQDNGGDTIYCTWCPRRYTEDEYDTYAHALAHSVPA